MDSSGDARLGRASSEDLWSDVGGCKSRLRFLNRGGEALGVATYGRVVVALAICAFIAAFVDIPLEEGVVSLGREPSNAKT